MKLLPVFSFFLIFDLLNYIKSYSGCLDTSLILRLIFPVVREVPTRTLHMIDIEDVMTADNQTLPRFSSHNSSFDFLIVGDNARLFARLLFSFFFSFIH